ncbi:hypothetical protein A9Q86_13295 [Flavobacteriales bacterium 33_180_T64]|nr:hypothetical protein A9Q86_13295 [Flavobacteriales bacterium 33_180_T64]
MNGSLSQFKATLRRRADRNEKNNGKFSKKHLSHKDSNLKPEYNFPTLETNELEALKLNIKAKLKAENRKNFISVLVTSIVLALLIYIFVLT